MGKTRNWVKFSKVDDTFRECEENRLGQELINFKNIQTGETENVGLLFNLEHLNLYSLISILTLRHDISFSLIKHGSDD